MTYVIFKPCDTNNDHKTFHKDNPYLKFTIHFRMQRAFCNQNQTGIPMTATTCNQHENGIFISHKQIKNRTKCIKKAVESLKNMCRICDDCKQAILLPNGVYCGKLREQVSNIPNCPHFDLEPLEYRLYRRV